MGEAWQRGAAPQVSSGRVRGGVVTTYARMKVDPGRARTEPGPLGGSCRGTFPSLEPNKVVVGEILLLYSSPGVYRRQARCGTRGRTLAGRGAGVSVAAATGRLRSICAHWPQGQTTVPAPVPRWCPPLQTQSPLPPQPGEVLISLVWHRLWLLCFYLFIYF